MPSRPIAAGSRRQLFVDDHIVERTEDVQRRFHRPVRYTGNPVIRADQPWEQGENGVYLFGGTVLFDEEEQIFKMWYRAAGTVESGAGEEEQGLYKACYAVSADGLNWEKPDLGLVSYRGSTQNNILPPDPSGMEQIRRPNIIKDYEETDLDKRYKMLYMDCIDGRWALAKGYSRDGVHWRMNAAEPTYLKGSAANGILFGWDPRRKKFAHFHRIGKQVPADVDGRNARSIVAVVCSTSKDFVTWGDTRDVLRAEPNDPPGWNPTHGAFAAILYTDDLYIGSTDTCTPHCVEDVPEGLWDNVYRGEFAEYRTELVISRDGDNWVRVAPRWEFLQPGLWGAWDHDHVQLAKPIVRDDEILIYYTGSNLPMSVGSPEHPQHALANKVIKGARMGHAVGLARMRLDGFVSMDGYAPGGTLTTRLMTFTGNRLVVNARVPEKPFGSYSKRQRPYGKLRVEVLDAEGRPQAGYSSADCDAFTGDEVRQGVTWKGKSELGKLASEPIRLKFYLDNAALYSFMFVGDETLPEPMNLLCPGCRGRPGPGETGMV